MNKLLKIVIILVAFFIICKTLVAQYQSRGVEYDYEDAEQFYTTENYYDALPLYEKLSVKFPKILEYQVKVGVCHMHLNSASNKAIESLKKVYDKKPKTDNILYYLAQAYALNYQFDIAIETYQLAIKSSKTSAVKKEKIPHLIEQCNNAKGLIKEALPIEIKNLGEPINSIDNEYAPTINADESKLIFTYRGSKSKGGRQDEFNQIEVNGNFYDDVYVATKDGDQWSIPELISDSINSNLHEGSIALSPDGQTLFTYKDTKDNSGDIFLNIKGENGWSESKWLSINSEYWEGSAAISPDGKLLFFSSDRKGGYGGKDIYKAKKQEDGSWGEVVNLGETINTPYDDDAPFIHSDGVTFNFSSKGHASMGGYDIFESKIGTDSTYLAPKNIGYPINTTFDDIFFFVSGSGNAYYSSVKDGGYGQHDIYVINVKDIISSKPVLLVKGIIKLDEQFARAKIVLRTSSGKDLGTYYSDAFDGKYQFYADLGDSYEITYQYENLERKTEIVDAKETIEYTEVDRNINFIAKDVVIDGVALIGNNQSPVKGLKVNLSNKSKTVNDFQVTDKEGRYRFSNLPKDEYSVLFSDEDNNLGIKDSIYMLKGKITVKGLPYSNVSVNETAVDDNGNYEIKAAARYFFKILKWDYTSLEMMSEEDILVTFGDERVDGLVFKVQVGAYTDPNNFEKEHLSKFGAIDELVLDDGLTRYTIGNFLTLNEANVLKNKILSEGQTDAFIIIFVNGKRTYLDQFILAGDQ